MKITLVALGSLAVVACGGNPSKPADAPAPAETATTAGDDGRGRDDTASPPETNPAEGQRLVNEEDALLLDVRSAEEYDAKHIGGAKRIGVDEVADRVAEIEEMAGGKDKPVVVYCGSGRRASRAQEALEKAGFSAVTNLGGVDDWTCDEATCHEGSEVDADGVE